MMQSSIQLATNLETVTPEEHTIKKIGEHHIKLAVYSTGRHSVYHEIINNPTRLMKRIQIKDTKIDLINLKILAESCFGNEIGVDQAINYFLSTNNLYFLIRKYNYNFHQIKFKLSHSQLSNLFNKYVNILKMLRPHGSLTPANLLFGTTDENDINNLFNNVAISSRNLVKYYDMIGFTNIQTPYTDPTTVSDGKIDVLRINTMSDIYALAVIFSEYISNTKYSIGDKIIPIVSTEYGFQTIINGVIDRSITTIDKILDIRAHYINQDYFEEDKTISTNDWEISDNTCFCFKKVVVMMAYKIKLFLPKLDSDKAIIFFYKLFV